MTFLELLRRLEQHLGSHQLPVNPRATSLRDVLDGVALHPALVQRLIRTLYESNGCRRLTDPVARSATLAAVGPLRHELLNAQGTDIDLYRFIEDFCGALTEILVDPAARPGATDTRASAEIIPFNRLRGLVRLRSRT